MYIATFFKLIPLFPFFLDFCFHLFTICVSSVYEFQHKVSYITSCVLSKVVYHHKLWCFCKFGFITSCGLSQVVYHHMGWIIASFYSSHFVFLKKLLYILNWYVGMEVTLPQAPQTSRVTTRLLELLKEKSGPLIIVSKWSNNQVLCKIMQQITRTVLCQDQLTG